MIPDIYSYFHHASPLSMLFSPLGINSLPSHHQVSSFIVSVKAGVGLRMVISHFLAFHFSKLCSRRVLGLYWSKAARNTFSGPAEGGDWSCSC